MREVLDQPTINQFTELDQRLHLMNHELASIYIAGTQRNLTYLTMEGQGIGVNSHVEE